MLNLQQEESKNGHLLPKTKLFKKIQDILIFLVDRLYFRPVFDLIFYPFFKFTNKKIVRMSDWEKIGSVLDHNSSNFVKKAFQLLAVMIS